jgi:Tfp pilus assembly protein PilV
MGRPAFVPSAVRGSSLVEVLVAAAILAVVGAAAFSATAASTSMALRGSRAAGAASVLGRALGLASSSQPVPATVGAYTVTTTNRALVDGTDIGTARAITNGACQGSCGFPRSVASAQLRRYDVTVRETTPTAEGATVRGATFTGP